MNFLIGIIVSLFPARWRAAIAGEREIDWVRATFVSGLVTFLGCALALIFWYLHFIQIAAGEQAGVTAEALGRRDPPEGLTGAGASYAMGLAALLAFAMQPTTWVLAILGAEGLWRTLAATITEETPASLPFAVAEAVRSRMERRAYERRVPLVADEVTPGVARSGWDLRVACCRPKPHWKYPQSVRYRGEFFTVIGETDEGRTPARPHVYLLRRAHPHEALRAPEDYDPQELLAPRLEPPASGLGDVVAGWKEQRRIAKLPRMRDAVRTADGKEGWHLRIESCRPKPEWTPGRTIQHEAAFFKLTRYFEGSVNRPFGFELVRLGENEAVRGPLLYSPEDVLHEK
jgi:hypothetical protein